jgi:two-component system sensor histidine kinase KdpD
MDAERPDPDALLERVRDEETRASRARLKIFFGFAPGVGKTFDMLRSAGRLLAEGVDVVVGCVETHGRKDTAALLTPLEILPRRSVEYRGTRLEELDVERALARRPKVLLVDELAHTNAPGSRHDKRWQDVLELLEAGIDIHTTLNVQHVESLNDVVAQISGVRVRETVPDAILDRADELELVDIPPDELLGRLADGKVYLAEQAERAAQGFFSRGNLLALRELALRRTADRVDIDMQAWRRTHEVEATWPAAERIVVAVSPSPHSARLVRATRRMAAGLRAPWVAVYVATPTRAPMTEADQERLDAHLRLAASLGGETATLHGTRAADTLIAYARQRNATRIVVGKPTHPRLLDLLRGSLLDALVRESGGIDVLVISGDEQEEPPRPAADADGAWDPAPYLWSTALVAAATVVSLAGQSVFALPDLVMIYLSTIMVVAARWTRGASVLAATLSVAAYDFCFVPPYFTFAVSDARHVLTFSMMFAVGLLVSSYTLRIRQQEVNARAREARTATLYALSRALGAEVSPSGIAQIAATQAADILDVHAAILLAGPTPDAGLVLEATVGEVTLGPDEQAVTRWAFDRARPAGRGTDTLPGVDTSAFPLAAHGHVAGVLALVPRRAGRRLDASARDFVEAFAGQVAVALGRARLAREAEAAALRARTEELRSSLLSAVSHDLRTPLAAITGVATMLRDGRQLEPEQARELLDTLCGEAERLERLVGNLLDMTRLESGALAVAREWVPLEEVVGSALGRVERALGSRPVTSRLPVDLPLVSVDPLLLEQLLINLLENAAKYTPSGTPIELEARSEPEAVVLELSDRGPGFPPGEEERVFGKFQRGAHPGVGGSGLGLAIARGIAEAHGATLTAHARAGGGATLRLRLPRMPGAPVVEGTA